MSSNNTDPAPVVIAVGSSYFLHFTSGGHEQRYAQEPSWLKNKTIFVTVVAVDGGTAVEETILNAALKYPFGMGWQNVDGSKVWRRRRVL